MTTAQVVETSVTVNDNSPIQDYVNPDDQTQPTFEMTPGFKPFTVLHIFLLFLSLMWQVLIMLTAMGNGILLLKPFPIVCCNGWQE